jgi:hypothetical protein
MSITAITRSLIMDAVAIAQIDGDIDIYEKYSGRGMYGRTCVGVTLDNADQGYPFIAALTLALIGEDEDDGGDDAIELASRAVTDSLGRGTILYFPGVTLVTLKD